MKTNAKISNLALAILFIAPFNLMAVECSNIATSADKELLCSGESHPVAYKLCMESVQVERDEYGRIVKHSYKADATLPELALLDKMCDKAIVPGHSDAGVKECRSSMRVKVNLNGRPVGFSYSVNGENIDKVLGDVVQVGNGAGLCDMTPPGTLARKVCVDNLKFDQEGDYITTYTRTSVSSFPTTEEAKTVCKKYPQGSSAYGYCRENTTVQRDIHGRIIADNAESIMGRMPASYVPTKPACAQIPDDQKVTEITPTQPTAPSDAEEVREEYSSVPPVTIENHVAPQAPKTGEVTVLSIDNCKAVWGDKSDKITGEVPDFNKNEDLAPVQRVYEE